MARLHWIALLLAAVFWPYAAYSDGCGWNAPRAQLAKLSMSIQAFELDCARLPGSLDELFGVVVDPGTCFRGGYARVRDLRDPYGRRFHYWKKADGSRFELRFLGKDGVYASADDDSSNDWAWPWPNLYRTTDWWELVAVYVLPLLLRCRP